MSTDNVAPHVRTGGAAVVLAWLAGLAMVAFATSVVGIVVAPVAAPLSFYVATRRTRSWAVRVPLLLGALALTLLFGLWLLDGAGTGTQYDITSR